MTDVSQRRGKSGYEFGVKWSCYLCGVSIELVALSSFCLPSCLPPAHSLDLAHLQKPKNLSELSGPRSNLTAAQKRLNTHTRTLITPIQSNYIIITPLFNLFQKVLPRFRSFVDLSVPISSSSYHIWRCSSRREPELTLSSAIFSKSLHSFWQWARSPICRIAGFPIFASCSDLSLSSGVCSNRQQDISDLTSNEP